MWPRDTGVFLPSGLGIRCMRIQTGAQRGIMWSRHQERSIKLGGTVTCPMRLFTILRTTSSISVTMVQVTFPMGKVTDHEV